MIDLKIEERLFSSYTISFGIPEDDPKSADLVVDAITQYRGETFFITKVEKDHNDDGSRIVTIEAEAWWMRLVELKKPGTVRVLSADVIDGLEFILQGTGWSVGEDTENDTLGYYAEATDSTVLGLVWQWAKTVDKEVIFDNRARKITLVENAGITLPIRFIYDRNMRSIKRHIEPPSVTRLYAFGKNDLTISSENGGVPYLEDYSYYTAQGLTLAEAKALHRKDDIYNDPSVADSEILMRRAQRYLAAYSGRRVMYDAKVVDVSSMSDMSWQEYKAGDYVSVYDTPLNIDTDARISRIVKYPHNPERNEIELTFAPVLIPDNQASSVRSQPFDNWEMFMSRNEGTPREVRQGSTILTRLKLVAGEDAEWIVGFSLSADMVGTGTLTVKAEDDEELIDLWPEQSVAITNGTDYHFNFTYGRKNIPPGEYVLVVRANSSSGTSGLDIPADAASMWVLAKNTTKQNVVLDNSIRFDFNGDVVGQNGTLQTWQVPDDVSEVRVELNGAKGGTAFGSLTGGKGCQVLFDMPVIAGETIDVYCGGCPGEGPAGGWPNGGAGGVFSADGGGGGGSTHIAKQGQSFANVIGVAAGGGGSGARSGVGTQTYGGYGAYYVGQAGLTGSYGGGGQGGTQTAGGAGGISDVIGGVAGENGDVDGQGFGGDVLESPGVGTAGVGSGGGGGGWHGGGGGGGQQAGGGGGSSHVDSSVWDLEFHDDHNDGHGFVIISWEVDEP